jgi:sulfur carrier protein
MKIRINGKPDATEAKTVAALLQEKNIEPQMVSVELNSRIIERESYPTTPLSDGDQVEFLFFMGGGA